MVLLNLYNCFWQYSSNSSRADATDGSWGLDRSEDSERGDIAGYDSGTYKHGKENGRVYRLADYIATRGLKFVRSHIR